jgi:hypothetical protein
MQPSAHHETSQDAVGAQPAVLRHVGDTPGVPTVARQRFDVAQPVTYPPAMSPARAKTFADRLEPVVAHIEEDISHLSEAMADAVYPGRVKRPFRITLVFERFGGENYPRALTLAAEALSYVEVPIGETVEHRATFEAPQAQEFYELYRILREIPSTQVAVNGVRLGAASGTWPLFMGILGGQWAWEPLQ